MDPLGNWPCGAPACAMFASSMCFSFHYVHFSLSGGKATIDGLPKGRQKKNVKIFAAPKWTLLRLAVRDGPAVDWFAGLKSRQRQGKRRLERVLPAKLVHTKNSGFQRKRPVFRVINPLVINFGWRDWLL